MEREDVIAKIQKLLALSTSTNEHEAAAAAARAAELMAKYEIEEASLKTEGEADEPVVVEVIDGSKQRIPWKGILSVGLAAAHGVGMYNDPGWGKDGRQVTIKIVGQQAKIRTVRYLFAYLCNEVDRLADERYMIYGIGAGTPRAWKNAFRVGASSAIQKRLKDTREASLKKAAEGNTTQALVLVKRGDDAVVKFMENNLKLHKSRKATVSDNSAYAHGARAGHEVNIVGGGEALGAGTKQIRGGR